MDLCIVCVCVLFGFLAEHKTDCQMCSYLFQLQLLLTVDCSQDLQPELSMPNNCGLFSEETENVCTV